MIFWALALLFLVFVSKLSLVWAGVPSQFSWLVFQHGLHPYMNIALCFLFGILLVFNSISPSQNFQRISKTYRTFVVLLVLMLFLETTLQFAFLDHNRGFYNWAALLSTIWIVTLFGMLLPMILEPQKTVKFLSLWSVIFVVLSLTLLIVRPELTYKGGRFIGLFKHIPYMVTCASIGAVFPLACLANEKRPGIRLLWLMGVLLSLGALVLTGTRSALAAVLMAWVLWLLRVPTQSARFRFLKFSGALVFMVTSILFGPKIIGYVSDISTGKKGLIEREAQDGVASRLKEVERGWEIFQASPWVGQGLLSKFSGQDSLEVSSYNSFRDPHNVFASAGVVGGWPFIIWTALFLILLVVMAIKALMAEKSALHIFGIYAIVQIPIILIYHWHLSLGGMADRFYWLVFGYLALQGHYSTKPSDTVRSD